MNESTEVATTAKSEITVISTPDSLIERALDNGADVETIGKLLDLREQFERREAEKAFNEAFSKWQTLKPVLVKTKKVSYGNTSYKYCPLDQIEAQIQIPLRECGLSYKWQGITHTDGRDGQRCIIKHSLGHSEVNDLYAPPDDSGNKNAIQSIASRDSYLQRYSLKGSLGLVESGDDDDGVASGDLPLMKLIEHNKVIFSNLLAFMEIRAMLGMGNLEEAVKAMYAFDGEMLKSTWIAPSNGGFFTTEERELIRSNEFVAVRDAYFAEKNRKDKAE